MRVGKATAERIRQAAREAGYRTNLAAQTMRTGKFNALGLLLSTSHSRSLLPGPLLDGILDCADAHDLHLTVSQLPDAKLQSGAEVPKILRQWLVDGLLINYNSEIPEPMLDLLSRDDTPAIWINSKQPADCVHPDDLGAARIATERLIALGHRRIAYAIYASWNHYSASDRSIGYTLAMSAAGLPAEIITADLHMPELVEHAAQRLRKPDAPTAILLYAPRTLSAFHKAARNLGLDPGQITLAVFNDRVFEDADTQFPTFVIPERAMGEAAVNMLVKRIADPAKHLPPLALPFEWCGPELAPPPPAAA